MPHGDSPGACHGKCVCHTHAGIHTHKYSLSIKLPGLRAESAAVATINVTVDQEIKECTSTRVGYLKQYYDTSRLLTM